MSEHNEAYELSYMPMLELIWGKGFIAPGGEGNVDRIVQGLNLEGKKVIEIGSGIGGGAIHLARKYGASVLGLEIEAPLVERAKQLASEAGLADRIEYQYVVPGPCPVPDNSADVVYSSGVICHIENKVDAFRDALRILKTGGTLAGYDWLKSPESISTNMREWMRAAALHIFPDTLENYALFLGAAGFKNIHTSDASDWYRQRAAEEYAQMTGPLNEKMAELGSNEVLNRLIEEWRAMRVVLDSGELQSGYFRGTKP